MSVLLSVSQGYPQALLPLTVAGIPSIHICLDFIPELLAQPQLEKQVRRAAVLPSSPTLEPWTCFWALSQSRSSRRLTLTSKLFCRVDFSVIFLTRSCD